MFHTQWGEWNTTGVRMQRHSSLRDGSRRVLSKMCHHLSSQPFRFVYKENSFFKKKKSGVKVLLFNCWTYLQAGPRICLGKDSAYLQMKMTVAILCRFYKFSLVPDHPVQYRMMTVLSMAHGLKVTIARRS